jgi:hypothetical protein
MDNPPIKVIDYGLLIIKRRGQPAFERQGVIISSTPSTIERAPGPNYVRNRLALLWQIYSRCVLPIHFRQWGHRRRDLSLDKATMAWRTAGKVG